MEKVCTHIYPVSEEPKTYCKLGCGCFISSVDDGGPKGVDPRGKCPNSMEAKKERKSETFFMSSCAGA